MRRLLFAPLVLLLLLVLGGCQDRADAGVPAGIAGKDWFYAHLPEEKGLLTYKLAGTFEPKGGMGIDGFRLETDGSFVRHTQGPDDAALDVPGTWKSEGPGKYRISLRNGQPAFLLTLELLDAETLRAREN
ncbi:MULTISPECIES: hypothetical protein [Hymenobacter]|uniref:Uncharacterized protein n=1 Tax=Hymenobacter yonginensis TaxID=748197 RepID=A0ABY7PKN3_9BACT|nr:MULTISPECIES: hypothetical protein [Hymenobacter]WBO83251.1 hypothetical protein O9Z63_12765 [Hymenobacter yonginensis]